jgi:hypothetical protein
MNTGAAVLESGDQIIFNAGGAFSGTAIDGARTALTLSEAGYWRITTGLSVEALTGAPTLHALRDGADMGVSLRITAPGDVSFDWIHSCPANTRLSFAVRGGQITLAGECNAYLTAAWYGV